MTEPGPDPLVELIATHEANGVDSPTLVTFVRRSLAEQVRQMCHWVAARGDAREVLHSDFHFGDTCPYEAAAAVLRGKPDPREANRRNQAGDRHRTEAWRKGHESFGSLSFGWDCLDCTEHGQDLPDGLAAERGAEWHARHPHHTLPRAGALAEIALEQLADWDLLAEALDARLVNHEAGDSGEYDTVMHWPDGRSASGRDLLIIVSADADLASSAEQRYATGQSLTRMAAGTCPQCGRWPGEHTGRGGVDHAGMCTLSEDSVLRRLAVYKADQDRVSER